jgi:hypothetical protein
MSRRRSIVTDAHAQTSAIRFQVSPSLKRHVHRCHWRHSSRGNADSL